MRPSQSQRTTCHTLRLHVIVSKAVANKHHVLAVFIDTEKCMIWSALKPYF